MLLFAIHAAVVSAEEKGFVRPSCDISGHTVYETKPVLVPQCNILYSVLEGLSCTVAESPL